MDVYSSPTPDQMVKAGLMGYLIGQTLGLDLCVKFD
jgi:hypothetical protein